MRGEKVSISRRRTLERPPKSRNADPENGGRAGLGLPTGFDQVPGGFDLVRVEEARAPDMTAPSPRRRRPFLRLFGDEATLEGRECPHHVKDHPPAGGRRVNHLREGLEAGAARPDCVEDLDRVGQ